MTINNNLNTGSTETISVPESLLDDLVSSYGSIYEFCKCEGYDYNRVYMILKRLKSNYEPRDDTKLIIKRIVELVYDKKRYEERVRSRCNLPPILSRDVIYAKIREQFGRLNRLHHFYPEFAYHNLTNLINICENINDHPISAVMCNKINRLYAILGLPNNLEGPLPTPVTPILKPNFINLVSSDGSDGSVDTKWIKDLDKKNKRRK